MNRFGLFFGLLVAAAIVAAAAEARAGQTLSWVAPEPGANLIEIKKQIEAGGGTILTLAPEGALLVSYPEPRSAQAVSGVACVGKMALPAAAPATSEHGMGLIRPTVEQEARCAITPVSAVEPNALSRSRASLQGLQSLPALVDNSLSIFFPPVRNQGSQNSCSAWSSTYYYNTFTQCHDEGLNASSNNAAVICSPAFTFNLLNGGANQGLSVEEAMGLLDACGACSLAQMPWSVGDWLTWPGEAAWIDAMARRTKHPYSIGSWYGGCTDAQMTAIKQHLANGNVAVTTTDVYANWYQNYPNNVDGVNNGVLFRNSGAFVGSHALTLVGYDDNKSYVDGAVTKHGAVLVANSWGNWGSYNTAGTSKGFMWVGYDFFKSTNYCFGVAYYNSDRPRYRSRLYAVSGLNQSERGYVKLSGGIGDSSQPSWLSGFVLNNYGGYASGLSDARRIAVDLTDGADFLGLPSARMFARMSVSSSAAQAGSMTSAVFYHDLDGDGVYQSISSPDPALAVVPGATVNATAQFSWNDGAIHHFAWDAISSPRTRYQPFGATIRARDVAGQAAGGFNGAVSISGCIETTRTIGADYIASPCILGAASEDSRAQCIYLNSELGTPTTWTAIVLNVTATPGQMLENFTVRMKHTPLSSYTTPQWETGWTTVYQHDKAFASTGPARIDFDAPFHYNGVNNLMIDFSFDNDGYSTWNGNVSASTTAANRMIYQRTFSFWGNPLDWSGSSNPDPVATNQIPNIKLISARAIAVMPGQTDSFSSGVWSGSVAIPEIVSGMFLIANDGAGHSGRSNCFNVQAGPAPGALTVNIGPEGAASAGARWRRSGTSTWFGAGVTESSIYPGTYTVEFGPVPGFVNPELGSATVYSNLRTAIAASYTQMTDVWLDFDYVGEAFGTVSQPFQTLSTSVASVASGGVVHIKSGSKAELLRVTKPVRLQAEGGPVAIGR